MICGSICGYVGFGIPCSTQMNATKKKQLEAKGWKIGNAAEFLKLTPAEAAYVEMKLALSKYLKEQRAAKHLTQHDLARLLESSQSRVAKMEAGDPSVSIDLLIRSLLAVGASPKHLALRLSAHA